MKAAIAYLVVTACVFVLQIQAQTTSQEPAFYFEKETRTELQGENTSAVMIDKVKVWQKGDLIRIEPGVPPGGEKQVLIYRARDLYTLKMSSRIAEKVELPAGKPATPIELREYSESIVKRGKVNGTRQVAGQETIEYLMPSIEAKGVLPGTTHKARVSKTSHLVMEEVIEAPGIRTTISYQNVKNNESIPDEMFNVPAGFREVETSRGRTKDSDSRTTDRQPKPLMKP